MANIHSLSDYANGNQTRPLRTVPYSSMDTSRPTQQASSSGPLIVFGNRNSDGTYEKKDCLSAVFPDFKVKSFTFVITMVEIAVYLLTITLSHIYTDGGDMGYNCVLYESGAKYTPSITTYYHLQRLVLPIVLHGGFGHLFFNMLSQCFYSFTLEKVYGTKKFAFLYIVSGIGGNVLSAVNNTDNISIGASSSIFGVLAFYVAYLLEHREELGPRVNVRLVIMIFILLGNVASSEETSDKDQIDNAGHLGISLIENYLLTYDRRIHSGCIDRYSYYSVPNR